LPPVYVGINGTAVYHVGPMKEEDVFKSFSREGFYPPINLTINLTITEEKYSGLYLPFPVDYRGGNISLLARSTRSVDIQLWADRIPSEEFANASNASSFEFPIVECSIQSGNSSNSGSSFGWKIDRAGYFTLLIVDNEHTLAEDFDVSLDVRFFS